MLASRDPSMLPRTSKSNYDQVEPRMGGGVCSSYLSDHHNSSGNPIISDPFLSKLHSMRRSPCVLGSVRQDIPAAESWGAFDNSKLVAASIGDVVVYREQSISKSKMAFVIGMAAKRACGNTQTVLRVQVQRLYEFVVASIDNIASYRKNPKLLTVTFGDAAPSSSIDPERLQAYEQYATNKKLIKKFFRSPDEKVEKHAVLITVLSDHVA